MRLLGLIFCFTYCYVVADLQGDDEAAALQKDLQDFVRSLTHQQMRTTQEMESPYLQHSKFPLLRPQQRHQDEDSSFMSGFKFPLQSNDGRGGARSFASSFASVKRPDEDNSQAVAYASVKDVNEEEHLAENMESPERISTTLSGSHDNSPTQAEVAHSSLSEKTGPYTLKHQQIETVVRKDEESFSDVYFVAIVAGCCAAGIFGVISAGFCFYRLQKSRKAAADVDYPAYGVTGPCKDVASPNGDRKLAQSAQMYHYQHQKQQMIAVEKAGSTKNTSASDVDSEEENEEGDYTVYECPGLAPTGEMEVKNPLFHDDSTPVSPPVLPSKSDNIQSN